MVAEPLQSNEHLIYSHLKLAVVCIWLMAGCVALLSVLNKFSEATNHLVVADGIGIPSMTIDACHDCRLLENILLGT